MSKTISPFDEPILYMRITVCAVDAVDVVLVAEDCTVLLLHFECTLIGSTTSAVPKEELCLRFCLQMVMFFLTGF